MIKYNIFHIAFDALFLALFAILSYVPYIGYITIGPISFTTMHILVLVGAMLFGKKKGALFGLFMGVFSLLVSLQYPGTVNYLFLNPFVSILPRVLFGLISGVIFDILKKRTSFASFLMIAAPLAGILTLLHTVLTLLFLYVFGYLDIFYISHLMGMSDIIEANNNAFGSFGNFVAAFIAPGAICEIAAGIIIAPAIMAALYKAVISKNNMSLGLKVEFLDQDDEKCLSKKSLILITVILGIVVIALCALVLTLYYVYK